MNGHINDSSRGRQMRHCSGNEFGPRLRVGHNDKDQVFTHKEDVWDIFGVDFSPDATRLAVASRNGTAVLLDVELGTQAHTLRHEGWVTAAKYAPQGDRIAAGGESVRIWGSNDGRFLADIPVTVNPEYNAVLLWFGDHHLAVVSNSIIQRIDVYTGSAVSEWSVPGRDDCTYIKLYKSMGSSSHTLQRIHARTAWSHTTPSGHTLSSDDRFLATGRDKTIAIHSLSGVTMSTALLWIVSYQNDILMPIIFPHRIQYPILSHLHLKFQLPGIYSRSRRQTTRNFHGEWRV